MEKQITVIKLVNGDEYIGVVDTSDSEYTTLIDPLMFIKITEDDNTYTTKGVYFDDVLRGSKENILTFPTSKVLYQYTPISELSTYYSYTSMLAQTEKKYFKNALNLASQEIADYIANTETSNITWN